MRDADHAGEICRRRQPHWYSLNVAKFHTAVAAHLELVSKTEMDWKRKLQ